MALLTLIYHSFLKIQINNFFDFLSILGCHKAGAKFLSSRPTRDINLYEPFHYVKVFTGFPACAGRETSKNFDVMKRFIKIYISGWPGAKELRTGLMATKNGQEVKKIVDLYLQKTMVY